MESAEYWGGESFPADHWGCSPTRGNAVKIIHETLLDCPINVGLAASRIVDRLIEAGILPDELAEES